MIIGIARSALLLLVMVLSLAITITIASYFAIFSKSKIQPYQTAARIWGKFVVLLFGVQVSVSGRENIPRDRAVFFAANHQSFADDILILACIPINFRIVIAKEHFRLPVFGWGWRKAGYIPITREDPSTLYATIEKMVRALRAGESVLIFPEGVRTYDGKVGAFKHASLVPALQSGAPIIPIAISGSMHVWPRNSWIVSVHPVKFTFGKPIYIQSEADYDQKIEEVRAAISSLL